MIDYAKAPLTLCASLVFRGDKQLDEFPASRRSAIAEKVKDFEAQRDAAAKENEKRVKAERKPQRKTKAPDAV